MLYPALLAQDNIHIVNHKDMSAKDKLKVKIGYKKMMKARQKDRAKRDYKRCIRRDTEKGYGEEGFFSFESVLLNKGYPTNISVIFVEYVSNFN